jgi:hypothetical protein
MKRNRRRGKKGKAGRVWAGPTPTLGCAARGRCIAHFLLTGSIAQCLERLTRMMGRGLGFEYQLCLCTFPLKKHHH